MRWNTLGLAVRKAWHQIPLHFATVDVDVFVVMPNHVHGILSIVEAFGKPQPGSVPTIVCSFKAAAALSANQLRGTAGEPAWQRGYYEHVVRLQGELGRIRRYINANPACWAVDRENPTRTRDHA
jgi:REP element-mobilizing transposase RayT